MWRCGFRTLYASCPVLAAPDEDDRAYPCFVTYSSPARMVAERTVSTTPTRVAACTLALSAAFSFIVYRLSFIVSSKWHRPEPQLRLTSLDRALRPLICVRRCPFPFSRLFCDGAFLRSSCVAILRGVVLARGTTLNEWFFGGFSWFSRRDSESQKPKAVALFWPGVLL